MLVARICSESVVFLGLNEMIPLSFRLREIIDINWDNRIPSQVDIYELCVIIRDSCLEIYNPDLPDAYPTARNNLDRAVEALEALKPDLASSLLLPRWNKALGLARRHLIPDRSPIVAPISDPPSTVQLVERAQACLAEWEARMEHSATCFPSDDPPGEEGARVPTLKG